MPARLRSRLFSDLWRTTEDLLDIRTMSTDISAVLRNPRLVAVNQDPLGAGGRRVRDDGNVVVFAKTLSDGSVAVGLLNRGSATASISAAAAQIGLTGTAFSLVDLWTGGTSSSSGAISASVPARGVADKCLDANNQGTTNGTRVVIWSCNGQNNQKWVRV